EQPAREILLGGARARLLDDDGVDARELRFVGDVPGPRVHRVEHVLLEFRAELRELLDDGLVTLLALLRQAHARQAEILERALEHAALRGIEPVALVRRDRAVRA